MIYQSTGTDYQTIYQAERKENARDITGNFVLGTHPTVDNAGTMYGTSWTGSNQSERELDSDPAGVVTGFYFSRTNGESKGVTTIDISTNMKTIISEFPSNLTSGSKYYSEKGLAIELSNGNKVILHNYAFWDDGGGPHYQFYLEQADDILGLSSLVGQKVSFKAYW